MSSHPCPDRFELRRILGKGGVGEVLLTWDRERDEEVALKSVRLAEVEPDVVEAERNGARLQKELARAAPHVPRIFEEGNDGEFYYYVMEYVAGKDLSEVLARGPLSENRAIHIAIQLYDFLARLHSFASEIGGRKIFGIIHGDIKPENIRLQDIDRVRVVDFGIAKQLSLSRSFTKNLFGSLPYLPPERLEHGRVDVYSDLWAAAVVLYSMVGGYLPYAGRTEDTIVRRIRTHEITPLPGTCSRSLQWIIHTALSFEVERRFQSAAAVREHLEILRDGGSLDDVSRHATPKPVTTKPSQPVQSGQPPPDPPRPEPMETKPAETRKTVAQVQPSSARPVAGARGTRWLWPVAALLVLLGALALSFAFRDRLLGRGPDRRYEQKEGETASGSPIGEPEIEPEDQESRTDPSLELARAMVDGTVPDEDRFEALRQKARKRGFKDLDLFTAALADAYLMAGKRLLDEAGPTGGPYEREPLQQAFRSLDRAVFNYDKVSGAEVMDQRSEAIDLKNQVAGVLADRGWF